MKTVSIFILVYFPFFLCSQGDSSVDFIVGIDYSFRYELAPHSSAIEIFSFGSNSFGSSTFGGRANGKGLMGWRLGLNYNKRVGLDLLVKSGARLSSAGFTIDPYYGWGAEIDAESHRFLFLEIPLVVRYEMNHSKITPYFEGGFATNFLLDSKTETMIATRPYDEDIGIVNFVLLLAAGYNQSIHENYELFYQGNFRYHLTGIKIEEDISHHLYSFGLELGLRKLF